MTAASTSADVGALARESWGEYEASAAEDRQAYDVRQHMARAEAISRIIGELTAKTGAPAEHVEAAVEDAAGVKAEGASVLLNQRDKLGEDLRSGRVPEPTFLPSPRFGERLFYEGSTFLFAGHKKSGKSWAMTLLAQDCIAAGRPVVYIDNENGRRLFLRRLAALGADPDGIDEHFHYVPRPATPPLTELRSEFEALAAALPGALIILDSLRTFMARYGLNPNADVDVEQFFGPLTAVAQAPAERPITIGVIDHSNRATRAEDIFAAGGSQAKAAVVDNVYQFVKMEPFNRGERGLVRVIATDDREGSLDFDRYYRIGGQGEDAPLYFEGVAAESVGVAGRIQEAVRQYLTEHPGEPQSKSAVRKAVGGTDRIKDAALEAFVADPESGIRTVPNPHGAKLPWLYVRDDQSEPAAGAGLSF